MNQFSSNPDKREQDLSSSLVANAVSMLKQRRRRNVIAVARDYEEVLLREGVTGYRDVARHFGVTKATVSHYLAIVRRLPIEFVSWLEQCGDHSKICHCFSERRLRRVVQLTDRSEQIEQLRSAAHDLIGPCPEIAALLTAMPIESDKNYGNDT